MSWFPKEYKDKEKRTIPDIAGSLHPLTSATDFSNRVKCDDITFMIPYGTDTRDRFENLVSVLSWIISTTTAKIHLYISETPAGQKAVAWHGSAMKLPPNERAQALKETLFFNMCQYRFNAEIIKTNHNLAIETMGPTPRGLEKDFHSRLVLDVHERADNEPFHRTRYLNEMLNQATTSIVVNHDADVILTRTALLDTLAYFRNVPATDCVYPYGHGIYQLRVYDKNIDAVDTLIHQGSIHHMLINPARGWLTWNAAYGHSIFFKTDSYKKMHGENEEFISWGAEDVERYIRMVKFGFAIARVNEYVIHLEHPRGPDSSASNPNFSSNEDLWEKLQDLSSDDLKKYYESLKYYAKYSWGPSSKKSIRWDFKP